MNYQVNTIENGRGIQLKSYRDHLSLYQSDLKSLVTYNETEDNFVRRAESWVWDIIGDEYDRDDFKYNQSDLEKALRVVYKNLRKDFEQSAEFSAEKEKALANNAKKIADMKASISKYRISDYIWRKFKLGDRYWAWDSFSQSSLAVDCRNQIYAYHDTEKYINEHLEEFAYLSEEELQKKAIATYQQMLKKRRG
jgi:dGTP triphosphohydrolase